MSNDPNTTELDSGLDLRWKLFEPPGGRSSDQEPDAVVWVDIQKLNAAWPRDHLYIEKGGRGKSHQPKRYRRFGKWVMGGDAVEMPAIAVSLDGEVTFTDGRHRFAWLRDHGAKALPVAVDPKDAALVKFRFGLPAGALHG